MRRLVVSLLLATFANAENYIPPSESISKEVPFTRCFDSGKESVYDYTIQDIHGRRNISMSKFRNKTLVIVNVATYCGTTWNYIPLKELKSLYANHSFEIIAFPCNQFGLQEPGANATEILNGITYVRPGKGYVPNFFMAKIIDVNGENQHPLYWYLKRSCPPTKVDYRAKNRLYYEPLHYRDIRWNFEKFIIHPTSGKPVRRYDRTFHPMSLEPDVHTLVNGGEIYPTSAD